MGRAAYALGTAVEVRVNNDSGFIFEGHEYSLLEALEAQDVPVLHSCRGGYCGCCRVRLEKGLVNWHQESLVPLADDEILCCCCTPQSDVSIILPEE
ncbi:class I ribonucleotide reductase maintenance protein YfaE [Pokkaliibacter sp. CJK22405]|uniref:class I ribonucleotide reductase maintenance protein YfaE n=1 Tax=Pokkaliibacter sp. CJK22405 TaxID=3384615 RepID=UPI0039848227